MKKLKKFLVVVILITLSILALLIGQGYKMYKEAISSMIKYGNLSKEDANRILDKNI